MITAMVSVQMRVMPLSIKYYTLVVNFLITLHFDVTKQFAETKIFPLCGGKLVFIGMFNFLDLSENV